MPWEKRRKFCTSQIVGVILKRVKIYLDEFCDYCKNLFFDNFYLEITHSYKMCNLDFCKNLG